MCDGDRVGTLNGFLYRAAGQGSPPLMRKLIPNVWGGGVEPVIAVVLCLGNPRLLLGLIVTHGQGELKGRSSTGSTSLQLFLYTFQKEVSLGVF